MTFAFTFPGQGSQAIGMGQNLAQDYPEARAVFEEVDAALNQSLSKIMWEGTQEELTLTANAQPALMAVSLATIRVLEAKGLDLAKTAKYVAGHSLGEYSALAAAGTFSISDTAKLLRTRGQAMQAAVPVGEGAMAALLGLDFDAAMKVADEAAEGEICQAANDNGGGQVVVSGHKSAVERACEIAKANGARRAVMLPVSAPFHCALMAPAAEKMAQALEEVQMNAPSVPLVANVLASEIVDPAQIKQRLIEQVTGTVRWRESVSFMVGQGVDTLLEIGAGKVLSGMVRRIEKSAKAVAINGSEDIDAFIAQITEA
ncbi:ACP S-malonyltransferase [Polycladidibacter stylochi]|uniref:ACP S-malonyltransferase n=1 Tax=Polycladidibacter stylochi TaxID=1807766 RepID=UPI000832BD74|nr:ACP S-malonyltransferase [Pseudovibrio stylochi]